MSLFPKSFTQKLSLAYLTLFILVFTLTAIFISQTLANRTLSQLRESLTTQCRLVSETLTPSLVEGGERGKIHEITHRLGEKAGARITVIRPDGAVLGDSWETWEGLLQMENHRERPEVKTALLGSIGSSIRYSMTVKRKMLYVALPLKKDEQIAGVLRIALPLTRVNEILSSIRRPVLISLILGIPLTLLLGSLLSRYLARRIHEMVQAARRYGKGDLAQPIRITGDDEINILARAMNQMASQLKGRMSEIEAEKTKFSAILAHMVEGVVAVDCENRVLIMNPSAEAIFGINKGSAFGKNLIEIVRNQKIHEMTLKAVEGQSLIAGEIGLAFPEPRVLRANALGISKCEGGVCGILVLHDITEIRRLENLRREFVANVSHELKTPLTSLKGFIETLAGGALKEPERSQAFLKMMEEDTNRLTRLIEDLLELSKIESKEIPLTLEKLDLKAEIETVTSGFEPLLRQKALTFENCVESIQVWADRDRLRQVLINLIDNAIKFNKERGRIIVRAGEIGDKVRISVEDTGIGIPEKATPRIFERFFRVDKARSRELGGTGLGLAIVKHIIEAHGGSVSCESRLGDGSKFSFTLPTRPFHAP